VVTRLRRYPEIPVARILLWARTVRFYLYLCHESVIKMMTFSCDRSSGNILCFVKPSYDFSPRRQALSRASLRTFISSGLVYSDLELEIRKGERERGSLFRGGGDNRESQFATRIIIISPSNCTMRIRVAVTKSTVRKRQVLRNLS